MLMMKDRAEARSVYDDSAAVQPNMSVVMPAYQPMFSACDVVGTCASSPTFEMKVVEAEILPSFRR